MFRCLISANVQNFKSIAFPAIGTGALKYDAKTVFNAIIAAVKFFEQTWQLPPLKDVYIVVYDKDIERNQVALWTYV